MTGGYPSARHAKFGLPPEKVIPVDVAVVVVIAVGFLRIRLRAKPALPCKEVITVDIAIAVEVSGQGQRAPRSVKTDDPGRVLSGRIMSPFGPTGKELTVRRDTLDARQIPTREGVA